MKSLVYSFLLFSFLFVVEVNAQSPKPKKVQTIEFEVHGACGMCKDRIESALDYKGVKFAEWNKSTQMLKVVFNTKKIQEQKLHELQKLDMTPLKSKQKTRCIMNCLTAVYIGTKTFTLTNFFLIY